MSALLDQLEQDVLDEHIPVATALRKCVALGGRSGSRALRDWALRELEGYKEVDDLPDYRVIAAPIRIDGFSGNCKITGQGFPPSGLPAVARPHISEQVKFFYGVGALEELAKQPEIRIGLPGGGDLVRIMNSTNGNKSFQHIDMIYWAVSPAGMRGMLDQIRTALTKLVAELRASTPANDMPTEEAANHAIHYVISGDRATVNISTAHARGPNSQATATSSHKRAENGGSWITPRRTGAAIVGAATIAAAVFAAIQAF